MSKLSEMIAARQKELGQTDRQICEKFGWVQQTYNTWRRGVTAPRENAYPSLADFLGISVSDVAELAALASVREYAVVSDRKEGKFRFSPRAPGRKAIPEGRYSVMVDTSVMVPALPAGTKIWLDPAIWPKPGHEVLAFGGGDYAWLGRLESLEGDRAALSRYGADPIDVINVQAVHVVVLSERV